MLEKGIEYKMAYSFLKKRINAETLQEFDAKGVNPQLFFTLPTKELILKLGIRQHHEFDKLAREEALSKARNELKKIEPHNISPLFVLDDDYPSQLAETEDAPIILYKLGPVDLMSDYMVSVVGTRKPSPYGVDFCNKIINEISSYFPDAVIVSGLAYGIDATAHKNAIENNLKTVAVVAHGLNMIYPAANRLLAKEIIRKGGAILSEYPFDTKPFKPNFLARNRIVAGLSDATIVVESKIKGGAMSTANYAFIYDREVMALPGRTSDELSAGCNMLIRKNKAHLIECCADLIEATGWKPLGINVTSSQRNLFPELEGDSKIIYEILKENTEPMQADVLVRLSGFSTSKTLAILGELEFEGIIMKHPGNRFSIS